MGGLGAGHKGLYDTVNNSLHFQLGLALASVGTICSLVALFVLGHLNYIIEIKTSLYAGTIRYSSGPIGKIQEVR